MKKADRAKSGQTMVEYIIIVVIIAIGAIAIFGVFGDTIRKKLSGGINAMDSTSDTKSAADDATSTKSKEWLQKLDKDGTAQ